MFEFLDQEVFAIITRTLFMTFTSTAISATLGIPLGLWLAQANFTGKKLVVTVNRTLLAAPPVVVGLVVFLLFRRFGPFGALGWLFTMQAMIIAQVIIITPIICSIVYTAASRNGDRIRSFALTMGADKVQTRILLIKELSNEMFFSVVTGFGRAMSEVGAIMIVGGNIRHHTRTMTTSISRLGNQGEIDQAIFLGAVLMIIAFVVQMIGNTFMKKEQRTDENF